MIIGLLCKAALELGNALSKDDELIEAKADLENARRAYADFALYNPGGALGVVRENGLRRDIERAKRRILELGGVL